MAKYVGAASQGKKSLNILLGQCVPTFKTNVTKIRVRNLKLNPNLNMYYRKDYFYFAHDPTASTKTGDTVLIRQLPKRLSRLITHEVLEIVHPLGDVTDPITGKKVVMSRYRDHIKEDNELYGAVESAFDYDKAPPRGSQEDKHDFSHKPSYVKYHEDPEDPQPYAI